MRTDTVIAIVGAYEARNAAFRPTMPVPDGSCRARSWPGSSDETVNAGAAGRPALTRLGAAAGHPVQEYSRRRRSSSRADGACRRASALAAALGRGRGQLTPALLGVG